MANDDRKRAIGKVISVAADKFIVEMHAGTDNFTVVGFDDVHYVARLGSFLMIPTQADYVVVEVVGLREKNYVSGSKLEGEIDKASSAKFLDVVPVGMLTQNSKGDFRFGVSIFPSLYADVLYALDLELDRIFETDQSVELTPANGENPVVPPGATRYRSLSIGKSVVFQNYDVKVRIDDFFGGHVAVLGNTGSGKSCTVSSIIQSLFEKSDEHFARGATFVILDVNGEYSSALISLSKKDGIAVSACHLDGSGDLGKFRLPHWFLDISEWELLLQASEKTQLPILRTALGLTSLLSNLSVDKHKIKEHFVASCIIECYKGADGDSVVAKFQRVVSLLKKYETPNLSIEILKKYGASEQYGNFSNGGQNALIEELKSMVDENIVLPNYNNQPFSFEDFEECLDFAILYEEAHGNRQIRDYCSQMITRFKSLRDREEYAFLRHSLPKSEDKFPDEREFITNMLGLTGNSIEGWKKERQVSILDMSAVGDEVVELVASVLARMVFNQSRKANPRNRFPIHFVLEEAHRYIASVPSRYALDAARIFERISKEGRKYGLFLLIASQRPSELSKTVLSQCSTFIVHRIQNPDDLGQIRQMTPFISDTVLRRLPSLPKQHALVFGSSVNLPTTFKVRSANPLPHSDDARIRELWFHEKDRGAELMFGTR